MVLAGPNRRWGSPRMFGSGRKLGVPADTPRSEKKNPKNDAAKLISRGPAAKATHPFGNHADFTPEERPKADEERADKLLKRHADERDTRRRKVFIEGVVKKS